MTEYTDDPEAIMEYMHARDRTKRWVQNVLQSDHVLPPSAAPSIRTHISDSDDGWDAQSARSVPPRMQLQYHDGRVVKIGPQEMERRMRDEQEQRMREDQQRRAYEEQERRMREQERREQQRRVDERGLDMMMQEETSRRRGERREHERERREWDERERFAHPYGEPPPRTRSTRPQLQHPQDRIRTRSIQEARVSMPPLPIPPPQGHGAYPPASPLSPYTHSTNTSSMPHSPYDAHSPYTPSTNNAHSPYTSSSVPPSPYDAAPERPFVPPLQQSAHAPMQPSPLAPSYSSRQQDNNMLTPGGGPETIKIWPSGSSGSEEIRSRFIEPQATPTPHNATPRHQQGGRARSPSLGISYSSPTPHPQEVSAPGMIYTQSTPVSLEQSGQHLSGLGMGRPGSAMQVHAEYDPRGRTLPTPPPSAHGPPPAHMAHPTATRALARSGSMNPTARSASTSRRGPPAIVSSRPASTRPDRTPRAVPPIVYAPSRGQAAMDEAYAPPDMYPRSAPAHQTEFAHHQRRRRSLLPPPQPIPVPGSGFADEQRYAERGLERERERSRSRGRSKSRGRSSNESGVLVRGANSHSNGSSGVLVDAPGQHQQHHQQAPEPQQHQQRGHAHSHSYPQGALPRQGSRSGSLVRALLPKLRGRSRSQARDQGQGQGQQLVHARDLDPRTRTTSTSSGSTYYVLPSKGQKVHVIHTDDEAGSRYASTRSSASSRYPTTPNSSRQTHSRHASHPEMYAQAQHQQQQQQPPPQSPSSPTPAKKPFFFNRLFGNMHLRDRSLDSRIREKELVVRAPVPHAAYPGPSAMQLEHAGAYDQGAGAGAYDPGASQRGRKLVRRDQVPVPPPQGVRAYSSRR